jgi:hypothetical protein
VEAKVQNTIGYVSTERNQSSEEINTELDLDSAVELVFRTDYVPLDRLAGGAARERITANTINPEAEAARIDTERSTRAAARDTDRAARATRTEAAMHTPPPPAVPTPIDTSRLVTETPAAPTARPAPVTPAPVTPAPVTPAPVTPAPVTPAPVTPAPVTPAPVTPPPVTPAPVTPAPVTPAPVTPPAPTPPAVPAKPPAPVPARPA